MVTCVHRSLTIARLEVVKKLNLDIHLME